VGDLDLIISRVGNLVARRELAELRRIERWARALVDAWQNGDGPDDLMQPKITAELEAAVMASAGRVQNPGQEGRS